MGSWYAISTKHAFRNTIEIIVLKENPKQFILFCSCKKVKKKRKKKNTFRFNRSQQCPLLDRDLRCCSWCLLQPPIQLGGYSSQCPDHQWHQCCLHTPHFFQVFLQPLVFLELFMFLLSDVAIAWDGYIHRHCCPLVFIQHLGVLSFGSGSPTGS